MLSYHRSLVVHPVQPIDVYPQRHSTQFKIHDFPKARSEPEAQVMTHPFPLQLMMLKSTKPRVIVSEGEFQNITKNHDRLTASLFPIICPKSRGIITIGHTCCLVIHSRKITLPADAGNLECFRY